MRIKGNLDLRIEFSDGNHFIDVGEVKNYSAHSALLTLIDMFCSWVIFKDENDYTKIAIFPADEWREEWLKSLESLPYILLKS